MSTYFTFISRYRWLVLMLGIGVLLSAYYFLNQKVPFFNEQQDIFDQVLKIRPAPEKGFRWPFYVYIPKAVSSQSQNVILVEPLSDGKANNDFSYHDKAAAELIANRKWIADKLKTPLIIPVFHRKKSNFYTHALGRNVMLLRSGKFERLDLQLLAMVDNLRAKLFSKNIRTLDSILMMGFSSSGMFTNRFVLMHPERIIAATIGSPGGWPIVPVAKWNNTLLTYPVGVGDFEKIVGKHFNLEAFRMVPLFIYIGSEDKNDSIPYRESYEPRERDIVNKLFGETPIARWSQAKELYEKTDANSTFLTYDGIGHSSKHMRNDVVNFLWKELKIFRTLEN
jgi:hypothetical protein